MSDDLPVCDCGYYRDVCGCPEPPPERAILTGLIAELRGYQEDLDATEHALDSFGGCLCDELGQADRCTMHNLRMVARMADRAEARLRTLQTPGGSAGADLTKGEGSDDADV